MTRLPSPLARGLTAALVLLGCVELVACERITTVTPEFSIQVQAQPPAPPLANLPAVPQPPPPRRVILDGDVLTLDEPLSFDADGQLARADHQDILAEIAKWLGENPDVVELSVEVASVGPGSKRTQQKRSKALATQIVDALVEQGVAAERLVAQSVAAAPDASPQVSLRVSKRAGDGAAVGFEIEE